MKVVVSDTSAVSNLLSIGRVELLRQVFGNVLIPPAVESELAVTHDQLPSFIELHAIDSSIQVAGFEELDPGEVEAIHLAIEIDADALIIDDKAGRIAATSKGINCLGILGVLVTAKELGYLNAIAPILDELKANRFYLSETVRHRVLNLVDEIEHND